MTSSPGSGDVAYRLGIQRHRAILECSNIAFEATIL